MWDIEHGELDRGIYNNELTCHASLSSKCVTPLVCLLSYLVPASIVSATVCICPGAGSVITRILLGKVVTVGSIPLGNSTTGAVDLYRRNGVVGTREERVLELPARTRLRGVDGSRMLWICLV